MSNKIKKYINLTNGVEYLNELDLKNVNFIRINSTYIEQKHYDLLFSRLSDDLLLHLALGYQCQIYDTSCHGFSLIYRVGIPIIKYFLTKVWLDKEMPLYFSTRSGKHFICNNPEWLNQIWKSLKKSTRKKLKYYKMFLNTEEIKLEEISKYTEKDGNYPYFKLLILEKIHEKNI